MFLSRPSLKWGMLVCILLLIALSLVVWVRKARLAEWTIMVYMNSDKRNANTLELAALCNFYEMTRVENSSDVNVIVQLSRPGQIQGGIECDGVRETVPRWNGVARFRVEHNVAPLPEKSLGGITTSNMADPNVFQNFLEWAMHDFPAHHYMLIFFNHGDGVGLGTKPAFGSLRYGSRRRGKVDLEPYLPPDVLAQHAIHDSSLGFVTRDDINGDRKLFVRDVQDSLSNILKGDKFDIVGFDACLMGMIENAYAMSQVAKFMVASEELEPPGGWGYRAWLSKLVRHPHMEAKELIWNIIDGFNSANRDGQTGIFTTLSAIDLSQLELLARSIDTFADTFVRNESNLTKVLQEARFKCVHPADDPCSYGGEMGGIDLGFFLDHLLEFGRNKPLPYDFEASRSSLYTALQAAIPGAYASERSRQDFGSTGLAIYFPLRSDYLNQDERAAAGYGPQSPHRSDFDLKHHWSELLDHLYSVTKRSRIH